VKTVSVKLPEPLAGWLSNQAKDLGRSQSDIIREALEQRRKGSDLPSCHDLLQDLCGSIKGQHDLSTNPKHMKGFGE
jgi:hypothetical protein